MSANQKHGVQRRAHTDNRAHSREHSLLASRFFRVQESGCRKVVGSKQICRHCTASVRVRCAGWVETIRASFTNGATAFHFMAHAAALDISVKSRAVSAT
jgi:hypothetical protein